MAESEELKSLLMKGKEESEKVGLKFNIQRTNIMTSSPINSWQINGETVETVADFIFWETPKSLQMVTAAMKLKEAYSLEGKYDQPRQYIEKQRHYFVNKGPSSQFSCSVMSDALRPHELQHTRPPCPSPTPGVHPNSCPLGQ